MALIDDLKASYDFTEASGNAVDSHNGYDATETSGTIGATTGPGGAGGSRVFVASDSEYFTRADNADLSGGDVFITIEVWVYAASLSGNMVILGKGAGASGQEEYLLRYRSSENRFRFEILGGSGYASVDANTFGAPSTATWYQIILEHDPTANEIRIRVNAGSPDALSYSGGVNNSVGPFEIGRYPELDTQYWDGRVSKARVWKRALSSDEITELYNGGSGRDYAYVSGTVAITGQLTQTLAPLTLSATGTVAVAGTLTQTLAPLTLAATGTVAVAGQLTQTLAPLTLVATGTVTSPPGSITGTLDQTLAPLTLVATGTTCGTVVYLMSCGVGFWGSGGQVRGGKADAPAAMPETELTCCPGTYYPDQVTVSITDGGNAAPVAGDYLLTYDSGTDSWHNTIGGTPELELGCLNLAPYNLVSLRMKCGGLSVTTWHVASCGAAPLPLAFGPTVIGTTLCGCTSPWTITVDVDA